MLPSPVMGTVPVLFFVFVMLLCACLHSSTALAEEWTAQDIDREYSRFRGSQVESFRVRGIDDELADRLTKGLALSGEKQFLTQEKATFYPQTLSQDLERSRLFMARNGYPNAQVDVIVESAKKKKDVVSVRLEIDPGLPVRVAEIETTGVPGGIKESDWLTIRRGDRFTDASVDGSETSLWTALVDRGYARAETEARVVPIDTTHVRVVFDADPGPLCRFGWLEVKGTRTDLEGLVRRVFGIQGGTLYSRKRLEQARNRLRLLGLFKQVRVDIVEDESFDRDAETGTVHVIIRLVDRPPRSLETGVGFWSEELLRVQGRWQHRNIFRRGRGFEVGGLFSAPRRGVESSVWWPALFRANVRGELTGKVGWEYEEAYEARTQGGDISLVLRRGFDTTIRGGVELERVRTKLLGELEPGQRADTDETQLRLFGNVAYDNTNDRLDPSRGQTMWFQVRTVLPTQFVDTRFVAYEASISHYMPVSTSSVFAARAFLGWADPSGDELIATERFFAGGASSMRGYKRNRLGPLDSTNTPTGGEAKLELGAELRFPVWKAIRAAAFLDAAQVWENREAMGLTDLETAAGFGIIWSTAVGPVRVDFGFPLDRPTSESGDPNVVFHLLVGHPF